MLRAYMVAAQEGLTASPTVPRPMSLGFLGSSSQNRSYPPLQVRGRLRAQGGGEEGGEEGPRQVPGEGESNPASGFRHWSQNCSPL